MTDHQLTPQIIKLLSDKAYNKRKEGAQEVEKLIRVKLQAREKSAIEQIIVHLGRHFANSNSPQLRNGGLIGLAACAIALGKDSASYVELLVRPPLVCFTDPDSKIRYFACESLYNICKVARASTLQFFNDIFDALSKLADDENAEVRSGADLLGRLTKDIVTAHRPLFDIPAFIPLLRERIYSKKPFCRKFVVEWIKLLNDLPDLNMLVYLPEILDGLFFILGEPVQEIRNMCQVTLGDFIQHIKECTEKHHDGIAENDFQVDFSAMTNILIFHSQSRDQTIQLRALIWLDQFLSLATRQLLPFCPGIVDSILPTLAYQDDKKSCRECAQRVNAQMTLLIKAQDDQEDSNLLDSRKLVLVLGVLIQSSSMQTKIACLKWFLHLFKTIPNKIFNHVEEIFPLLFRTLSDPSDEVVIYDLSVLASIACADIPADTNLIGSSIPDSVKESLLQRVTQYFIYCMQNFLKAFSSDKQLLDEKGLFIIRQLCLTLKPEHIYIVMSELIQLSTNLQFASIMVRNLSTILLTAPELFDLRHKLKKSTSEDGTVLFNCLYYSWCHNPVGAVALCLLNQQYRLAADLLNKFGSLDITVELLTEVDKLVQLLESPIFIYLRLQLLEQEFYLVKALYSLLMLLPQSEAFRTLQARLHCVSLLHHSTLPLGSDTSPAPEHQTLLNHFVKIQDLHITHRDQLRTKRMPRK